MECVPDVVPAGVASQASIERVFSFDYDGAVGGALAYPEDQRFGERKRVLLSIPLHVVSFEAGEVKGDVAAAAIRSEQVKDVGVTEGGGLVLQISEAGLEETGCDFSRARVVCVVHHLPMHAAHLKTERLAAKRSAVESGDSGIKQTPRMIDERLVIPIDKISPILRAEVVVP